MRSAIASRPACVMRLKERSLQYDNDSQAKTAWYNNYQPSSTLTAMVNQWQTTPNNFAGLWLSRKT